MERFWMHKVISLLLLGSSLAFAVEAPAGKSAGVGYKKLPISDNESQMIYQIIDTLGTSSLLKLYRKEDDLVKMGSQIQDVHPLRFLEVILTDPHLKLCMVSVEDSYFKWRGFMKGPSKTPGFIAKCERESARDNFAPYIVEFCQAVDADPAQVGSLIERKKWEKLVRTLIGIEN
jgi:hypothetical protein